MTTYEVTYITDPISEGTELSLLEDPTLSAIVGFHSGVHYVSVELIGEDFQQAARDAAHRLQRYGVRVIRMELDLVNQSGIATQCDVTKQAVSKWVNSESIARPFPKPHTLVAGPLWAWSAVNEWLRCTGKKTYDDACSATPEQVETFNYEWHHRTSVTGQAVEYRSLSELMVDHVGREAGAWQTLRFESVSIAPRDVA